MTRARGLAVYSAWTVGWADLRTPKQRGGCGAVEHLWEVLDGSGCAETTPLPQSLLPSLLSNLRVPFQGNVTHMSLIHCRSMCKGKGQEAQVDVAVRLFS